MSLEPSEQAGDLSHTEAVHILDAKLGLMIVQHVLNAGWHPTAALGTQYGIRAAAHATDIGFPSGVNVFLDLEGITSDASAQSVMDYANSWSTAVSAGEFVPGLYVGANPILNADQLAGLAFQHYWKSLSTEPGVTGRGYQLIQSAGSVKYGLSTAPDNNMTQDDSQNGKAQWIREP